MAMPYQNEKTKCQLIKLLTSSELRSLNMLFTLLIIYQLIDLKSTYAVTRNERFKKFEAFKENMKLKAEVGTEMSRILQYYQTL